MDFILGNTCWHVVGYRVGRGTLLCKTRANPDYLYGGSPADVLLSEMPVCRNCDRITHGEASRYIARMSEPADA